MTCQRLSAMSCPGHPRSVPRIILPRFCGKFFSQLCDEGIETWGNNTALRQCPAASTLLLVVAIHVAVDCSSMCGHRITCFPLAPTIIHGQPRRGAFVVRRFVGVILRRSLPPSPSSFRPWLLFSRFSHFPDSRRSSTATSTSSTHVGSPLTCYTGRSTTRTQKCSQPETSSCR